MDKKTIGDWIMYYEVQRLIREGLSFTAIGKALVMDRRTVKRYSRMSEADYGSFLVSKEIRDKMLTPYESFVRDKLIAHPAVSAAQMHDWLKEHHLDFVDTAPKTVYNFVMALRRKYNIPLEETSREYFAVAELPYGQQAQADFGHYILRGTEERRKRIHFFVMMLSRSRIKFVQFSDAPFTTPMTIDAHDEAFKFFKEEQLHVHDKEGVFLCKHAITQSKGNTVINTDHKRDKSLKLKELLTQTASLLLNPELAMEYFEMIRKERGRYLRDQVHAIQKAIEGKNKQLVADVMQKCVEKKYIGAVIFREMLAFHETENNYPALQTGKIILLDAKNNKKADIQPDKSDLDTYEKAFANS